MKSQKGRLEKEQKVPFWNTERSWRNAGVNWEKYETIVDNEGGNYYGC